MQALRHGDPITPSQTVWGLHRLTHGAPSQALLYVCLFLARRGPLDLVFWLLWMACWVFGVQLSLNSDYGFHTHFTARERGGVNASAAGDDDANNVSPVGHVCPAVLGHAKCLIDACNVAHPLPNIGRRCGGCSRKSKTGCQRLYPTKTGCAGTAAACSSWWVVYAYTAASAGMIGSRQCSLGPCLHASPVQPERPRAAQLYVLIGNFSMFTLTWIGLIPKHMVLDASAGASLSGGGPLTDCPATAGGMLMSMSGAGWTYFVISILLMVPLTGANLNLGERNGQPCDWCRQPAVSLQ